MKKYILLTIMVLFAISCDKDFLERYPNTKLVIEKYYSTTDDAAQAVTAIYNMLLRDDWWSPIIFSELASDECAGGGGSGDGGGFQRTDRFIQQPDANANQDMFKFYFGGVYRANIYLGYENQIDWTGKEELKLQYEAEARFLRAYFNFVLTRMFGEIPLLDKIMPANEIPGRAPAEELFTFIINDLKFAAEHAISKTYPEMQADVANWGRATKWAAESMIARVYLYYSGYYNDETIGDFTSTDARVYIDDVINNSQHSLVSQFASLWRVPCISELGSIDNYAGEINPEAVWSIRYTPGTGYGSSQWQRMVGPRGVNIDPYGQGWGGMPVLPSLWNLFDATDSRKTATILSWDDEGLTYNYITNAQAQYTGYNPKKYEIVSVGGVPEAKPDWQYDAFEDYMVIRYSDVLLMGAELHLITGDAGAIPLGWLNSVRARAFGNTDYNYAALTLENIFAERKLELACEGIRYWDILRSCKGDFTKLVSILTYIDDADGGDFSHTSDPESLDVDGNNFVDTKGLFQIPQNEIELLKGVIEQNPGYTNN
jgi:starch-binding outer membrane protein, SusD/RagB family